MDSLLYDQVNEALMGVDDPELGVNIVDLGLVYDIDSNGKEIFITLTLTSPACPLSDNIEAQARDMLEDLDMPVNFIWTFSPQWNFAMMSEDGRDQIRAIGGIIPSY